MQSRLFTFRRKLEGGTNKVVDSAALVMGLSLHSIDDAAAPVPAGWFVGSIFHSFDFE